MGHEQAQQQEEEPPKGKIDRLARFISSRTGATYPLLRPAPEYSLNPFYWLGALSVVAFLIQGVSGIIMLLWYTPTSAAAYSSTQYIFKSVYMGQFLETIHLYTAYAMIMLAFMHMMRGYFVSVHKKPRELMWITGMLMGFVTLGFGFTGYLLPYTVVSVSASDVGVGMVNALPPQLAGLVNFLITGGGSTDAELLHFYFLHVVVLPAVLLGLLLVKMMMLETHGVAEPVTGSLTAKLKRTLPIFPDMTVYMLELAMIFGVGMLLVSALFPLQLQAQYSATAAGAIAAQPDWYFLWLYQILKISFFEHAGIPVALTFVSVVFIALILLPFIDRGDNRRLIDRPKFVTLGAVFVAEMIILAAWGEITPGQIISNTAAVEVLGGTALVVALAVGGVYYALRAPGAPAPSGGLSSMPAHAAPAPVKVYQGKWTGAIMTALMSVGALGIGLSIDSVAKLVEFGFSAEMLTRLTYSLCLLAAVIALTLVMLRQVGSRVGAPQRSRTKVLSRLGLN